MSDPFANNDPFANSATSVDDPWAEEPQQVQTTQVAPEKDRFSLKITLKAASGFDAEWLNPWVSGATAEECARNTLEMLQALAKYKVIEGVANAAEHTRGQFLGGGTPQTRPQAAAQQQSLPPGVESKSCVHGERVYRTGTNNYGGWQAWFCPLGKENPEACKAIFGKTK